MNENRYHFSKKLKTVVGGAVSAILLVMVAGCGSEDNASTQDRPLIVATHSILGAVVSEVAGEAADVVVLVPNGIDPHDWEPSAQDIETVNNADLVVANGLHLEARLEEVLENASSSGVRVFEATDHVTILEFAGHAEEKAGEHGGEEKAGDEHAEGDPHFWTDAAAMAEVVEALGDQLFDLGIDIGDRAGMTAEQLVTLDNDLRQEAESLTSEQRVLVTGHESMGYFANRYDFALIGAVIPSLSTQSEVSAGAIASLKEQVTEAGVNVIFTELGTPSKTVDAIAAETGAEVIEISTHVLPEDGKYETFMRDLMRAIVEALKS